jgi:hypothetical protein
MFLFPKYVSVATALLYSPFLKRLLNHYKAEVVGKGYHGNVKSLPDNNIGYTATFVRASSRMKCSETLLAKICEERGFLCFYDDQLITSTERKSTMDLLKAANILIH